MPATPANQREESLLGCVWPAPTNAMKDMISLSSIPKGVFHKLLDLDSISAGPV